LLKKFNHLRRRCDVGGRKCHVVGQDGNVVVRRNHFVALPDETSGHLFHVGGRDDYSVAQHGRIVTWRKRFDVQKSVTIIRRHQHDGRKFRFGRVEDKYSGRGNKYEGQLNNFDGQMHRNSIRKNRIVSRHLVQAVRQHNVDARRNKKEVRL